MTSEPEPPFRGVEYPSLENSPRRGSVRAGRLPRRRRVAAAGLPERRTPATPVRPGYPYGRTPTTRTGRRKPPGTNGKAIAALITSLLGLIFCGLPSIAGLILGVIAMRETRRTGQDGYGMALAGAIIGGLVIAIWVLYCW